MHKISTLQRLLRERILARYVSALERGDLDTLADIMQRAEHNAALETLIFELHATYQSEEDFLKLVQEEHDMDFKKIEIDGVHKSVKQDELTEQEPTLLSAPTPTRGKRARWLSTLAAILVVCVVAGGFLAAHIWRSGQSQLANISAPPAPWCAAPANMTPPGYLSRMSGLARNDLWAIQSRGPQYGGTTILHWDGTQWNKAWQANGNQVFNNILELTPNDVWVVGAQNTVPSNFTSETLILHWDGAHWQTVPSPNVQVANSYSELYALSADAANDIWAAGNFFPSVSGAVNPGSAGTLLEHWDGQNWTRISNLIPDDLGNPVTLKSVKALASNNVWIVGSGNSGSLIEHWNGVQWHLVAQDGALGQGGGTQIYSIDGTSANDLWAVGNIGNGIMIEHWDGKKWSLNTPVPTSPDNRDNLISVTAVGTDDAWAVGMLDNGGQSYRPVIEHWNGHKWQVAPAPTLSGILEEVTLIGNQPWAIGVLGDPSNNPSKPLLEMPCK